MTDDIVNGKRHVQFYKVTVDNGLVPDTVVPATLVDSTKVKVWFVSNVGKDACYQPAPMKDCSVWTATPLGWVCVEVLPEDAWHGVKPE